MAADSGMGDEYIVGQGPDELITPQSKFGGDAVRCGGESGQNQETTDTQGLLPFLLRISGCSVIIIFRSFVRVFPVQHAIDYHRCPRHFKALLSCVTAQAGPISVCSHEFDVSMPLTQAEADALLQAPKEFLDVAPLDFPVTQPLAYVRALRSVDHREEFLFDFERGRRNRARLKYQTRGRKVVILARWDLGGPAHRNPPASPYRPGERLPCPHFHRYVEGFEDRVAYLAGDIPGLIVRDISNSVYCLEDFLRYCAVQSSLNIQLTL